MDDSDQDFVDLASKLLKRVRKKPGEPRPPRRAEHQSASSQASEGNKRRRNDKKDGDSRPKVTETQSVCSGTGCDSGDAGSLGGPSGARAERVLTAEDKVLLRMKQFRRASPQRLVHRDPTPPAGHENDRTPNPPAPRQDPPQPSTSGLYPDSDEALALRLQQELDKEAAETEAVNLEDGGLFFCQICHRDLSHMNPDGRTQHTNRCLDDSEESAPPPPPPPALPECPICGKTFKSQKSRSTHLKRCSSDMGVPPAVLLQALQRQAEETQNVPTVNTAHTQTGGTKRKGPSKPGVPAKKKPRKKTDPLDEDTMVALALSSSLLEQNREAQLKTEVAAAHTFMTAVLKPDTGKGRRKKKKGAIPRPPPLLLVQDAQAALVKLQERVSALLLHSRAPSPPTPTRSPSSLCGLSRAAPLWQKSTLLSSSFTCQSDFYTQELREFITPWETPKTAAAPLNAGNKSESSLRPLTEGTPVAGTSSSILPSSSQTAASSSAPSTPGTGQHPVGSQALRDLMELAEDGMTPTQCRYMTSGSDKNEQSRARVSTNLLEESEEQADLCVSGFLPEAAHTHSENTQRKSDEPRGDEERGSHRSVALSRLESDLSSMVNNPQLSDVQIQVDSGDVYFAHSFMVYARCPLLAEMLHEGGFGVQEEGSSAAQRVLMSDVPGQAVFALLQYLYTAHCSIPASLRPHILELASRFDLQELQQLCESPTPEQEADYTNQGENINDQTDQAFMVLLRSMWNEEDEEDEGLDTDGGDDEERRLEEEDHQTDDVASGEREICEEQVNEEELEEIYEFAATQRKREEEKDTVEDDEEQEKVDDGEEELTEAKRDLSKKTPKPNSQLEPDPSLDLTYSRLFSDTWGVYEEKDLSSLSPTTSSPPKTHTSHYQKHQSSHKPPCELSNRTLPQSSPGGFNDFSQSPPPSTSNLPVAGLSPGQVGELDVPEQCLSLKREGQGPRSICVPVSPDSPPKKKEPELIVLSDSSEDMEVDVPFLRRYSPSPHSPFAVQKLQSYTQIKPQSILKPTEPLMENKVSRSLELNPDPSAALGQGHPGSGYDPSPDCSPEVSWLIPSTPVQQEICNKTSSSRSSSTQTKSSICRTQLFPRGESSFSRSSLFYSPALPLHNTLHNSSSATVVSARVGPTEGSVPRLNLEETAPCSSSFDLKFSPQRTSSYEGSKNREMSAVLPHKLTLSLLSSSSHRLPLQAPSGEETPQHVQRLPYSSTPLHTGLRQLPVLLADSPLNSSLDKQRSTGQGGDRASSESLEKTELGSFHLSPLSSPSSSHRGLHSSQKHKSSSESQRSVESSSHENTGDKLKRRGIKNEGTESVCKSKDSRDEGKQTEAKEESEEVEIALSSFQQSFMDEPPIAFNDSWGLDACVEANPGCFSLRLEDSGGSSQQERSLERKETTSADCHPPPSSHCMSSSSCGDLVNSSPSKAHSAQPTTSAQAHRNASFTPSPPDTHNSFLNPQIWDSWEEEQEEALPLSWRLNPSAQLKTPVSLHNKKHCPVVPITPMPHYSDMDTPDLKNKLNRFGVRPLPKRQMILKLKEIHQYTHQLVSSDSEDEAPSAGPAAKRKPPPNTSSAAPGSQTVKFKEPSAPAAVSPLKQRAEEEEGELLSASQGSNTSSTAASEESGRSNPELCLTSDGDSDSDGGISASQAVTKLQDRLKAVRSFILSDSGLYSQILQYQPLVLSQLQQRLKAAGIRLGAAKLMDYLDSQCITFTTAKPGHSAPSRRRGKRPKAAGVRGAGRKKTVTISL
ncbi:structure-specific endonuclease subunit SLX4 [Pleuronectes platessa]|uniref:structure-specific endonuclease subunit SLX4 n=1 Tax=Pleuronectes platessa TaxID=8262 RepID=UPI00232A2A02|nr:structure-specific endonuclease subunit SLX4 [Pleuronectes platessa]